MKVVSHDVVGSARSDGLNPDECQALVHRVLKSRGFEKSHRLQQFLIYICDRARLDGVAHIYEQEIGHVVFGRAVDYDTNQDNIVRVTASQVRRKLEQFFASEGRAEPLLLEVPKGQYVPLFRERQPAPIQLKPVSDQQRIGASPRTLSRTQIGLGLCAAFFAICTLVLAVLLARASRAARSDLRDSPGLYALWSQLLSPTGRTDIVVSDSSLSLFQELRDHQLSLSEYLKPDIWGQVREAAANPELQAFAQRAAERRFTSLANVTVAYRVAQVADRDQSRVSIFSAREFNIREMKFDNAILLGSTRANPWVELVQDRLNFRFGFDQQTRHSYFDNKEPHSGELARFSTDSSSSYCDVAFLPNLAKTGNILIISGTETEGTEGGGEFVTDEHSLEQLITTLNAKPGAKLPYFEVLLKSKRIDGAIRGFSIVSVRSPRL